ncbi:MAG TPA: penicillin-binding protein 2, partial [Roseiflexaceae bacterium]|nr:penicillin-binding protein 2 [Roseiflexaceae bacterium]
MATRSLQSSRPVTLSRWRINALLLVALFVIGRIILQLGNIQVLQHAELSERANSEIDRRVTIQPSRGVIRDRLGNVLALDVDRESLYVNPGLVDQRDVPKMALVLAGLLGMPSGDVQARLEDREHYSRIARWLEPAIAERVSSLKEQEPEMWAGLDLVPEPRRVYPQGSYAAHTIGAVNYEGVGISGVEGFYDTELKGITGTITAEWDPANNPIWITPPQTQPASNGADIELTLDPLVQHVIENELKTAVDAHDAAGGSIVVLDVKTGAIRGLASYPTFDPNRYTDYTPEEYNLNPAIGNLYEPGSTFKILTIAAGLQAHAFTPETTVDDPGVIDRYDWSLSNWDGGGHGPITPAQVLYYSSNVGALQFNEITGAEKFYATVKAFGYGQPTGVDMAGESDGIVKYPESPNWTPLDLDTNAFGQAIAVTPLQQARMVAAVGNDGKLMRPFIVQKRCHANNCVETTPQQVGQPISPEVAHTVRQMLIGSANHYVNSAPPDDLWLVPGYAVGAKTGTSDIPDGHGGYTGEVIGSVLGLAPIENARYAILVKIDRPADDAFGVVTAIPVFRSVAAQLLRYERIAPDPALVGPEQVA